MSFIRAKAYLAGFAYCYSDGVWGECRPVNTKRPVIYGATHSITGPRERNEDSTAVVVARKGFNDLYGAVVVADGVGGMASGHVASSLAVRLFVEQFFRQDNLETFLWQLHEYISAQLGGRGGTTVAVAKLHQASGKVEVATVGDSLVYVVEVGHTSSSAKGDAKSVGSRVIYTSASDRVGENIVTQALGVRMKSPHREVISLKPCTLTLAVSDGVSDAIETNFLAILADVVIAEILKRYKKSFEKYDYFTVRYVERLLSFVAPLTNDNSSVAAIFYSGGSQCF